MEEEKSQQLAERKKKPNPKSKKEEKNDGAFKLIPKAPTGVCIVLFFITFQ